MSLSIEDFLGLSEAEIEQRVRDTRQTIPTTPGTGYLRQRLKQFEAPPWPLLTFLAHHHPEILNQALRHYTVYDGTEASLAIMEQLREYYILGKTLEAVRRLDTH